MVAMAVLIPETAGVADLMTSRGRLVRNDSYMEECTPESPSGCDASSESAVSSNTQRPPTDPPIS